MRQSASLLVIVAVALFASGCQKEKKKGDVSASLMKSTTVSAPLALDDEFELTSGVGSTVQSFTPTALKIPIFNINVCEGESDCKSIYSCSGTVKECGVELSNIAAFVDALNAAPSELEDGKTYDHIGVSFCPEGDSSGIQHLSLSGTVRIGGTDYATDPTSGLVEGTTGQEVSIAMQGGCASFYPITPAFKVSEDTPTVVKLFFDASNFVYGGFAGGATNNGDYLGSTSCVGSEAAFVCAQVTTVVATVDSGVPTTEHYLVADTNESLGGSESSSPTSSIVLYFSSAGTAIGGVQSHYRVSGASVSWGQRLGWGLGLYPKEVAANVLSIGEPGGSIRLANWFKNFTRASHSGTYSFAAPGSGAEVESTYTATKL